MIEKLNKAFSKLPGVGAKTAQRFIYHLLERDRPGGLDLAKALNEAMENVKNCERCRTLTEKTVCEICSSTSRDESQLCIVETPSDIHVIEQSGVYSGKYFVLSGYLSPIDGIGAAELGLDELEGLLTKEKVNEIILATNATIEGDATTPHSRLTRMNVVQGGLTNAEFSTIPAGKTALLVTCQSEIATSTAAKF